MTDGECSEEYEPELFINARDLRTGSSDGQERAIWSIGVGKADMRELRQISGSDERTKKVKDFNENVIYEVIFSKLGNGLRGPMSCRIQG